MAIDPRTSEDIQDELRQSLSGKIDKLTNFAETSFNRVFISAFSEELHEVEVRLLAAQLSGWVDYAGDSSLTVEELGQLGVDGAEPSEVNQFMEDSHLDELAKIVGVSRNQGEMATGEVVIQTATDGTRIYEGLEVGTQPGPDGEFRSFFVDVDEDGEIDAGSTFTTPSSGSTQKTVSVIAEDVGDDYNVGAGSITFLPSPDPGIEGVNNPTETSGGVNVQSNDDFREDIKTAVFEGSGGGTASGIEGFIEDNVSGVADVALEEFTSVQPPYVDVIVDGGSTQEVMDAIAESRPTGIEHNLVRPESVNLGVRSELVGSDINESYVQDVIEEFLTDLSLDDEFRQSRLIQSILNSDDDIVDLASLSTMILSILDERHTYQTGTSVYELDFEPIGTVDDEEFVFDTGFDVYPLLYEDVTASSVEVIAEVSNEESTLTQGTDYDVVDNSGDGRLDSIDFSIGGDNPDNRSVVEVEYDHESWDIDSTIEDESGDTFSQGTDWALVDNDGDGRNDSIDWSVGGSTPDDGEEWTISYEPKRTVTRDLAVSQREKASAGSRINTKVFGEVNL